MSEPIAQYIETLPLLPIVFGGFLILLMSVLVALYLVARLSMRFRDIAYPAYEFARKEAEQKSAQVLRDAHEQARNIRASAEMQAGKIVVERKREIEAMNEAHIKELQALASEGKELLAKHKEVIQQFAQDGASRFKQHSTNALTELQHETEMLKQLFAKERGVLEQALQETTKTAQEERLAVAREHAALFEKELTNELAETKKEVALYREKRLALIDREIVGLVEEVTHAVLNKSLSLDEHTDVIVEALKVAKQEGVFGLS